MRTKALRPCEGLPSHCYALGAWQAGPETEGSLSMTDPLRYSPVDYRGQQIPPVTEGQTPKAAFPFGGISAPLAQKQGEAVLCKQ
jgi:hypothetical protein